MELHQVRAVEEKKELDVKIGKLTKFNKSIAYNDLEGQDRLRLSNQLVTMHTYSNILNERINSF